MSPGEIEKYQKASHFKYTPPPGESLLESVGSKLHATAAAAEEQMENLRGFISEADAEVRVAKLKLIRWQKLTAAEKGYLLKYARETYNSFEIGAFIEMAENSGDAAWSSVLGDWQREWQGITRGWQTFLRDKVDRALRSIGTEARWQPIYKSSPRSFGYARAFASSAAGALVLGIGAAKIEAKHSASRSTVGGQAIAAETKSSHDTKTYGAAE
jgi:hypothetical protein